MALGPRGCNRSARTASAEQEYLALRVAAATVKLCGLRPAEATDLPDRPERLPRRAPGINVTVPLRVERANDAKVKPRRGRFRALHQFRRGRGCRFCGRSGCTRSRGRSLCVRAITSGTARPTSHRTAYGPVDQRWILARAPELERRALGRCIIPRERTGQHLMFMETTYGGS